MTIEWTAAAVAELETILSHIADQSPMAAAQVAERVLQAEASIERFPGAGKHDGETERVTCV